MQSACSQLVEAVEWDGSGKGAWQEAGRQAARQAGCVRAVIYFSNGFFTDFFART